MKDRISARQAEKRRQKRIAKDRIVELFVQADSAAKEGRFDLANRYVTLARKISMKLKVQIPRELKRKFCKHCYKYLLPGKTSRIRIQRGRVIVYCLNCRKFMRFILSNKKQEKKHDKKKC